MYEITATVVRTCLRQARRKMAFKLESALKLREQGRTYAEIAVELGVTRMTVYRNMPREPRARRLDVDVAAQMRLRGEKIGFIANHFSVTPQAVSLALRDHPAILEALAKELTTSGFDVAELVSQLQSVLPTMKAAA